jgi:hypothetical protein
MTSVTSPTSLAPTRPASNAGSTRDWDLPYDLSVLEARAALAVIGLSEPVRSLLSEPTVVRCIAGAESVDM